MIDTIKIFTAIRRDVAELISARSDVKASFSRETGELYYEIISTSLEGSFSSSLSVRVSDGGQYGMESKVLILEGSYHKICKGQNSYDGFWNVQEVCLGLIKLVENAYQVKLPKLRHWFLQRIDITNCYDLHENQKVCRYINNLSRCQYPRRKLKFFDDESIYLSGRSTTLKIYNKLLEFKKNDFNKIKITDFDVVSYINRIQGFVRFECEIKKKKLVDFYGLKIIRVTQVKYDELESIWRCEFMKLLKLFDTDLGTVRNKDAVEVRLNNRFGTRRGRTLYNFYISVMVDGSKLVHSRMSDTTFYRNMKDLRDSGIDLVQSNFHIVTEENEIIDFDPFTYEKVV